MSEKLEEDRIDRAFVDEVVEPEDGAAASARAAGLCYVVDGVPGYTRRRRGKGFSYYGPTGIPVTDPELRERFEKLVIPPAWRDVWICPDPYGHIQATGRDEKGRKQYIYHPLWGQIRSQTKFDKMLAFSRALPTIREQVDRDLRTRGLSARKVTAAVVRLLEMTLIRIGNPEYARANKTFGLVTLHSKHLEQQGEIMTFKFKGKSGKEHRVKVRDPRLSKLIKQIHELPGQQLFQYIDETGRRRVVESNHVNAYLREVSGDDITAKDFRTWGGTVLTAVELYQAGPAQSERETKRQVVQAVKQVANYLGNTPAVTRSYYIHPRVIESYEDQSLFEVMREAARDAKETRTGLQVPEEAVVRLLERDRQA